MTHQIDTCRFLARCLALLGQGNDWLAQCHDSVTEWDVQVMVLMAWFFPVGQHYKVTMSVHCHKLVPVLI